MLNLPENSIVLIEDIDTENATKDRSYTSKSKDEKTEDIFSFTNLSDILNSIDGLISNHGRILIATTNHKDNLDKALIRDGRFDLKIELKTHGRNTIPIIKLGNIITIHGKNGVGKSMAATLLEIASGNYIFENETKFQ